MDSAKQDSDTSPSARQMRIGETFSEHDGPESPSTTTYETFIRATKPHGPREGPLDDERWEQSDVTPPLTPHGQGTVDPALAVSIPVPEEESPTEPQTFDWQMDGGNDKSWGGKARSWIHDKPGRARSLSTTKVLAVWIPQPSSAEASPAKTSVSPDEEPDSPVSAPDSSMSSLGSLSLFDPDGFSSRTYPVSSLHTAVGTSESCLERWPTSGTAWLGGLSTHVTSECRSDGDGCSSSEPSLTEILEPPQNVPDRFSLSARAATGILRRALKRGRILPGHLKTALELLADK